MLCLFCGSLHARTIMVLTENLPPFQTYTQGKLSGPAVEIVTKVFVNANIPWQIATHEWSESYLLTQKSQDTCSFSMSRTRARENMFTWIGQLASVRNSFYTASDNQIHLDSLEDAKKYRVAVLKHDVFHQYLLSQGFEEDKNLYVVHNYQALLRLLRVDTRNIDLAILNRLTLEQRLREEGVAVSDYREVLELPQFTLYFYLACNKNMDPDIKRRLRQSYSELVTTGQLAGIHFRWGLETMKSWSAQIEHSF